MRRTLLTFAAFALCATGIGYAAADLMPAPGASHGTDVVLDTTDRPAEPVAHGGPLTPAVVAGSAVAP